ncbi:MAG: L,D-transpeptidase family protein [Clostridiales bacterium]|nr:L,D-transpeptidase family protein [Clostridiales bacterium]
MSSTKRSKKKIIVLICITVFVLVIIALFTTYFVGKSKYKGKFLPNTFVNGVDISKKTPAEVCESFGVKDPNGISIQKRDGQTITIAFSDFDYDYNIDSEIQTLYDNQNLNAWVDALFKDTRYELKYEITYDETKLYDLLVNSDWGSNKNKNASIQQSDTGYTIDPEVQGDDMDIDIVAPYVISCINEKKYEIIATDSNCYTTPGVTSVDLQAEVDQLNKYFNTKINYNFDYTTETLTGQELMDLITVNDDFTVEVNKEKVEAYVKQLSVKYDTYNTERAFKSTLQGNITIPTSNDAKYGWWIDKEKTVAQLTEMLKSAESKELVEPIYYNNGLFDFKGLKSARTENDDIGNTYVEIDLTSQKLWYYEAGVVKLECSIVSGKLTPARKTEAGVYMLWYKDKNHRMKATNSAGESWDSTCTYWSSVSPVGIGLHDAQFRSSFGGTIYKQNGSHGCINMSLSTGKFIYDNVDFNTPVVMYY